MPSFCSTNKQRKANLHLCSLERIGGLSKQFLQMFTPIFTRIYRKLFIFHAWFISTTRGNDHFTRSGNSNCILGHLFQKE